MEANFGAVIERVAKFLNMEAKKETVVGEQFALGEFACVPVVRVGMGKERIGFLVAKGLRDLLYIPPEGKEDLKNV